MILTFAYSDDWEAVYLDGRLLIQNSMLSAHTLALNLVNRRITEVRQVEVDQEWSEEQGRFPQKISDLKLR